MRTHTSEPAPRQDATVPVGDAYQPPAWRVIPLDCEITAYAPDDQPLF